MFWGRWTLAAQDNRGDDTGRARSQNIAVINLAPFVALGRLRQAPDFAVIDCATTLPVDVGDVSPFPEIGLRVPAAIIAVTTVVLAGSL